MMTLERKLVFTAEDVYCPVRATLALLGRKWIPHIIYELTEGKRRFNELAAAIGGCNSRTLSDRLRTLEELEIVRRRIVSTTPPWVEYALTERGQELAQALTGIEQWGLRHMSGLQP